MTYAITSGEATITSAGPVSGTLGTGVLAGNYEVTARVRGLGAGQRLSLLLEASAAGTFTDTVTAARWEVSGSGAPEGDEMSASWRDMQLVPFGGSGNALRFNVVALDAGATAQILGFLHI